VLTEAWGCCLLFCGKGWTEVAVEAMNFGKFGLRRLGVVKAEQRHPQIIVSVRESRIEPHGFAVLCSGILVFPCVEKSSAVIEPDIGILRLQRHQSLLKKSARGRFYLRRLAPFVLLGTAGRINADDGSAEPD
jgi:hypothetical protein